MARPSLSRHQLHLRRKEILDAAQDLFENQGLEAVSLRRIAASAGCSPNTPYRYFPSKEHVLLGLRVRAYETIRGELETAAASEHRATDRLRAIAATYIRFAVERPATYELLYRRSEEAEGEPELERAKRAALDVCRRALADASTDGELQMDTDALTAAHLFWAAAHGVVSLHLGGQLVMGCPLDRLVPILISTLMTGLLQRKEAS